MCRQKTLSGTKDNCYWIFLSEKTIVPEIWKPVFQMPETVLILLRRYELE